MTVGGTYANGQVYTVTMNRKEISYTSVAGDDNTAVAVALKALLAAAEEIEFTEVTWTLSALVITGTSSEPGVPFTNTSSATGTGTLVTATTTASAGPHHWDTADNWTLGTVPVATEDVWLVDSDVDILYGIDQNAVTLGSLNSESTFTGKIGLPDVNEGGYYEYRNTYLKISATTTNIGRGDGAGSSRIRLNTGTVTTTMRVERMGSPDAQGKPALEWIGTGAGTTIHALQGAVGVAINPGEVATLPTIQIGHLDATETDVTLYLGSGCTLTTITQNGGQVQTRASVTTYNLQAGTLDLRDAAAVTTLTNEGGYVYWRSTGTLGTTILGSGATLDASRDLRSRTATTLTLYQGATLLDPRKTITFANGIALSHCSLDEVTLDLGDNISLQRS